MCPLSLGSSLYLIGPTIPGRPSRMRSSFLSRISWAVAVPENNINLQTFYPIVSQYILLATLPLEASKDIWGMVVGEVDS